MPGVCYVRTSMRYKIYNGTFLTSRVKIRDKSSKISIFMLKKTKIVYFSIRINQSM